jgi:hypothetical protein
VECSRLFNKILDWNPFLIAGLRSLIAFVFLLDIVRTFFPLPLSAHS